MWLVENKKQQVFQVQNMEQNKRHLLKLIIIITIIKVDDLEIS